LDASCTIKNPDPDRMMLLRYPSEVSASELTHWDELAVKEIAPDPQSCGSAWQISALACSRRAGSQIVLRQTKDSQIAFSVTRNLRGYQLGPLEGHWYFGSPVMGADALELLREVVCELRAALNSESIQVLVSGLDPKGQHARQISASFPAAQTHNQDPHIVASLAGGIDGWLSRRSGNFRRNLKRAHRQAQLEGVVFERAQPSSLAEADRLYERMLGVERKSWKGPVRKGLLQLSTFYRMVLRAYAERNCARVVIARHGSDDVGFCFGGASGGHYRGQQTSYRDNMSGLSIGTLMHFETARWLAEEGAKVQHFGPIQRIATYKHSFCELELPSVIRVFAG
jgi:hypothetical protein